MKSTMKKVQYFNPIIDTIEIAPCQQLMAGSNGITANDDIDLSGDPILGDAADAAGHEFDVDNDFDWSDFKQLLLILVFTLTSLFANAQVTVQPAGPSPDGKKHAMTLYLAGGGTAEFNDAEAIDHVTYLPGIGIKIYLVGQEESIDFLYSQLEKIEYQATLNLNANWEKVGETMWTDYPEAWRLEYPQVSYAKLSPNKAEADGKCQIIVKTTDTEVDPSERFGITYSLEWDNRLKANRWTCYQLHAGNTMTNVKRNDDFKADSEVFNSSELSDYSGSGFSRGHLCPSADRLCSNTQNKQTFFLTNMQPQYQSHNGGLWSRLESQVRDYATDDSKTGAHCDTLYVVKAATIADVASDALTENSTSGIYAENEVDGYNKLIVPRYFYMALLHYNKATDTYRAIAFWTKHLSTTQPVGNLGDYAISINKLEELTGLDFFCNLPDDIENNVEKEEPDLEFWKITKSE